MHAKEEKTGYVDDWEMRCEHHRLCVDHTTGSEHLSRADCRGHGVLVNFHILNKCNEKLERMELRLLCKPHGIGHRKRRSVLTTSEAGMPRDCAAAASRCVFVPPDVL